MKASFFCGCLVDSSYQFSMDHLIVSVRGSFDPRLIICIVRTVIAVGLTLLLQLSLQVIIIFCVGVYDA